MLVITRTGNSEREQDNSEVFNHPELVESHAIMPAALSSSLSSSSSVALGTLQASNPAALVAGAAELAGQLAIVIKKQNLATVIKGKQFVNVEGWTTLATMLGVTAREVCTVESEGVYTATVELVRMSDGACISRASAECGSSDEQDKYGKPIWSSRPRYARRSMAQTRATGKACRLAFSWIMSLAGYEPTPAEEMMPIVDSVAGQEPIVGSVSVPAIVVPEPTHITVSQQKLLEAQIRDYGLDFDRVKAWLKSAWQVEHFSDLSPKQFERLLIKLENWASDSYAKAEAASALSPDAANF